MVAGSLMTHGGPAPLDAVLNPILVAQPVVDVRSQALEARMAELPADRVQRFGVALLTWEELFGPPGGRPRLGRSL
jgi:hypothetical protein